MKLGEIQGLPAGAPVALEAGLQAFIAERDMPLYRMMSFQLGWVDENGSPAERQPPPRLHGMSCLAAAEAVGGGFNTAIWSAVAVELAYNFWQVHADVEDGNTERDGRPSVWWAWGPAQAINAGDGMHAMARLAMFRSRHADAGAEQLAAAIKLFDEAIATLCEGEYLDISFQEKLSVRIDEYLAMAEARTGALFGCAMQLGATAGGCMQADLTQPMAAFGIKLGAARQVGGDIAALWGNAVDKSQTGRLTAKKKSLPVVHAIATGTPTVRRKLGDMYVQRSLGSDDMKEAALILDECGSRKFAQDTYARLLSEADQSLVTAGLGHDGTELMRAVARSIAGDPEP